MVTAMVFMNVARGQVNEIADLVINMEGVSEAYSVSGHYDLVALIRVHSNEELADIVTNQMQKNENILHTETMITLFAYSRRDLDSIFEIGSP